MSQSGGKTGLFTREIACCPWLVREVVHWRLTMTNKIKFLCLGIAIITWVIILKQLFASGSWILVNITLDFVSGNIHQYSLRLRRIIVNYSANSSFWGTLVCSYTAILASAILLWIVRPFEGYFHFSSLQRHTAYEPGGEGVCRPPSYRNCWNFSVVKARLEGYFLCRLPCQDGVKVKWSKDPVYPRNPRDGYYFHQQNNDRIKTNDDIDLFCGGSMAPQSAVLKFSWTSCTRKNLLFL